MTTSLDAMHLSCDLGNFCGLQWILFDKMYYTSLGVIHAELKGGTYLINYFMWKTTG